MNIFSTRDERYHRELKRKIGNAYSVTSLLEMEPAVDSCSKLLMEKLAPFAEEGKALDLGAWMCVNILVIPNIQLTSPRHYYASDVVGEIAFQRKIGFLEKGADIDQMIEGSEGFLTYSAVCGMVPSLHSFLLGNPILPYLVPVSSLPAARL
jgi:hypothetical protein